MTKYRSYILVIFFLTGVDILPAEKINPPDSLMSRLKSQSIPEQIDAYLCIIDHFSRIMPDEAYSWGENALRIAKVNRYRKGEADIYYKTGLCYHLQSNYAKAMECYQISFHIRKEIMDNRGIGEVLNRIALIHNIQGNYEKALDYCLQSVSMLENERDKKTLAESYNHLGIIYYILNDISKAKEMSYKALKLLENTNNPLVAAYTHEHLGIIYIKTGENDKAVYHTMKALELRISKNDKVGVAGSYENLGIIYRNAKNYHKALEYYYKSLELKKELHNERGTASSINGIGVTYVNMGEYEKGLEYIFQAYNIRKKIGDKRGIVSSLNRLAETYTTKGDFRNALEYYKLAKVYNDSLLNEQKNKAIAEFQEAFQHERRDKEILHLQRENSFQRYLTYSLVIISLLLLSIAVTIFIAYRSKRKMNDMLLIRNNEVIKQKEELQRLNEELKKLNEDKDKFFTIIAHDLKSPFTALLGYSEFLARDIKNLTRDEIGIFSESIFSTSGKLFALLENLLCWARFNTGKIEYNPEYFSLSEVVEDVLCLYKGNADKKEITISTVFEGNTVVYADAQMINTVLRNLLSNAIKFSYPKTLIETKTRKNDDFLEFCIEDHGMGIDSHLLDKLFSVNNVQSLKGTAKESGTGLGLYLCKEFVEKNNGCIWADSKLNEGSRFFFSLPAVGPITGDNNN